MAEVFIGPFAKDKLHSIEASLLAEKSARRIKGVGDFAVYRYHDEGVGAPGPGPGREAEIDVFVGSTALGVQVFAFGEIAPSTPRQLKVLVKRALARL